MSFCISTIRSRAHSFRTAMLIAPLCFVLLTALAGTAPAAEVDDAAKADAKMRARVDEVLQSAWKEASVKPADPATDAEFLRRVNLDLIGCIPTVSEVRTYLDETSPDKRAKLVDSLLDEPAHATHLADVWCRFLLPDDAMVNQMGGTTRFESWLRNGFAENRSYAELVRELLLAKGQPNESGPALYYTSLELKPEKIAASTSRAFLGIQIQCAECHNHPFDKWTQRDFWGYAAFFARVSARGNNDVMPAAFVKDQNMGEVMLPNSKDVVPPRYLLGDIVADKSDRTRREYLAEWMTSKSNPYFAKAAVNRIWAQLFGRGIVDPPDDMREPEAPHLKVLLSELSTHFAESGYDVKRLFRVLAMTEAYQLSSGKSAEAERAPDLFAEMQLKMLSAEQLYSCVAAATCRPYDNVLASVPSSTARRAMTNRTTFVNSFRAPSGSPTEYLAGIPQALMLLNGRLVDDATALERSDILVSLEAPFLTDAERVETLFLATLSRPASPEIGKKFEQYVASQKSADEKRNALGNVLWALLNSAEFGMNH